MWIFATVGKGHIRFLSEIEPDRATSAVVLESACYQYTTVSQYGGAATSWLPSCPPVVHQIQHAAREFGPGVQVDSQIGSTVFVIGEDKIVAMSLPSSIRGYVLTPDDGEALWFNKGLLIVKATADQTEGKYSAVEMRGRKGFSSPLHVHHGEDEFFIVLSGDVRFQLGDEVFEATAGSMMYGPREVPHSFHVDSSEARLLLLFGPAGTDNFFRTAGKPARSFELPPADEQFLDRERLMEIGRQFDQEFVGPPLPPKG